MLKHKNILFIGFLFIGFLLIFNIKVFATTNVEFKKNDVKYSVPVEFNLNHYSVVGLGGDIYIFNTNGSGISIAHDYRSYNFFDINNRSSFKCYYL